MGKRIRLSILVTEQEKAKAKQEELLHMDRSDNGAFIKTKTQREQIQIAVILIIVRSCPHMILLPYLRLVIYSSPPLETFANSIFIIVIFKPMV